MTNGYPATKRKVKRTHVDDDDLNPKDYVLPRVCVSFCVVAEEAWI